MRFLLIALLAGLGCSGAKLPDDGVTSLEYVLQDYVCISDIGLHGDISQFSQIPFAVGAGAELIVWVHPASNSQIFPGFRETAPNVWRYENNTWGPLFLRALASGYGGVQANTGQRDWPPIILHAVEGHLVFRYADSLDYHAVHMDAPITELTTWKDYGDYVAPVFVDAIGNRLCGSGVATVTASPPSALAVSSYSNFINHPWLIVGRELGPATVTWTAGPVSTTLNVNVIPLP